MPDSFVVDVTSGVLVGGEGASEVVTLPSDETVDSPVDDDTVLAADVASEELEDEPPEPTKEAEIPVEFVQPDGTEPGPPATKRIAAHW